MNFEKRIVAVASISHLTPTDFLILSQWMEGSDNPLLICYERIDCGIEVNCDKSSLEDTPGDTEAAFLLLSDYLVAIIKSASSQGFQSIWFHPDGPILQ